MMAFSDKNHSFIALNADFAQNPAVTYSNHSNLNVFLFFTVRCLKNTTVYDQKIVFSLKHNSKSLVILQVDVYKVKKGYNGVK